MGFSLNGITKETVRVGEPPPPDETAPDEGEQPNQPLAVSGFVLLMDHFAPGTNNLTWRTFGPMADARNKKALAMILRQHADRLDPPSPLLKPGDPGYFQPPV